MRRLLGVMLLVLAWPVCALAAPDVSSLVDGAIQALKTKSYDARLRFLSQFDGGGEKTVHIYHVAPELYRVVPLYNGAPGDAVYIENSVQLVRMKDNRVQPMPARQYYVTDMLTAKFLRDLGNHKGTTILDGQYNGVPVYYLRQDVTHEKPYLVTVGLRTDNKFPMFLQVVDSEGQTRVHYEFESIKFVPASALADDLFTIPEPKDDRRSPTSHVAPLAAPVPPPAPAKPAGKAKAASRAETERAAKPAAPALPLFPAWLPQGYALEAISVLDYSQGRSAPAAVYHFEIYGPKSENMLSLFEMKCDDLGDCKLDEALAPAKGGYMLQKHGDWVVAVFGEVSPDDMQRLIQGLDNSHHAEVKTLLDQTRMRDEMMQQAVEH